MTTKRSLRKNSKAVSPVISTIIIVSVAIVMSIAVAYWMLGLGTSFTRFEKLEFQSAYVEDEGSRFVVNIRVKNTGTAALTLDEVFLNGKPLDAYAGANETLTGDGVLEPGDEVTDGTIELPKDGDWNSGMSVEVTIRTAGGRDYPKTVVLP